MASSFTDLQPRLTALTEGVSGGSIRAQQAFVTFLFSAAQAQFGFGRGLAEDMAEAFRTAPAGNPALAVQTLVSRWHDRSEAAVSAFRRLSDDLRKSLYDSVAEPLAEATAAATEAAAEDAAATEAAGKAAEASRASMPPAAPAKVR